MEEEIEIIEDNIDEFMDILYETYRQSKVKPFEKALHHLISAYKKLEEENKEWQKAYQEEKDAQFNILINSIPNQAIRDKIEEYRKKRIELANGHFWENADNINQDTSLFIAVETLKHLLEEE